MKTFRKKRRQHESGEVALQITSLADVFTILLVFMLKGYASGALNVTPTAGTRLPSAVVEEKSIEAMKVEISSSAVQIESKPILKLNEYRVAGDLNALDTAFDNEKKRQEQVQKLRGLASESFSPMILIADERTPYETIQAVVGSASAHGFSDLKLAVIQSEGGTQ